MAFVVDANGNDVARWIIAAAGCLGGLGWGAAGSIDDVCCGCNGNNIALWIFVQRHCCRVIL